LHWPPLAQALEVLDAMLLATLDGALLDTRLDVRLLDTTDKELEERNELDTDTTLDFNEETALEDAIDFEEDADETTPLHTAPVTTGVSTAPLVVTWRPKVAVCPG
jgi:hypothetical protein